MAVLDEVPHITARVRVAGELATEYSPLDDQEAIVISDQEGPKVPTAHCYIESKSDAQFVIESTVTPSFKFSKGHDCIVVDVYIDGQPMCGQILCKSVIRDQPGTFKLSTAQQVGRSGRPVAKKFVFAAITKNCDPSTKDRASDDIERAKTLGKIHLILQTGQYKGSLPWKSDFEAKNQQLDLMEKALKGKEISHATVLAESSEKALSTYGVVEKRRKFGEFVFHYRSYQALQHEMIIPRTPSPGLSSGTGLVDEALTQFSERDTRRLAMERLQENLVKDESPRVKREADRSPCTPRQWKMVKIDDGKVAVDLTED
ncbi:uncharacterized protein FTOL_05383 [Fusarium torulosum]|uniref:DUF7918 domain-containing protein n=1 Tax=Fusarium torulosum TaxID=33205 RepID=A0AAE8M7G5_9HYPO|nr:uncharacterized protein FTOL_05383 [Fusarium torulosum]